MSKRKRGDDGDDDGDATAPNNFRQQRRIMAAFMESSKHLTRAFKLAKGLEQQKMGRRTKTAAANKDQKEMDRIAAERVAVKALQNTTCAEHYLAKSLLKFKAIATSPDLPKEMSTPAAIPRDAASLNVHARLCKSNPVQEAFPAAIAAVKREFGLKDDHDKGPLVKKRMRAKDFEKLGGKTSATVDLGPTTKRAKKEELADELGSNAGSGPDVGASQDESENEFGGFDDRLASSDDEQSGGDDDLGSDIEELERRLQGEATSSKKGKLSKTQRYDPAADLSLSEGESENEPEYEEPKKAAKAPKKSSFIPSLTMGGYISGSGSDVEDDSDVAPQRKNRRGQRARQKIWEQKYKAKANHLKNQDRNQGWDPKRGAVGGRPPRFAKGANSMPVENQRRNFGRDDAKKPRKDDSGPLHPSWEAAKRAKEKKSAPVAFSGKKISFD